MIDHKETPSGWWDVERDGLGTWRADYHYGNDRRSLYGFATREEACLATWGENPPTGAILASLALAPRDEHGEVIGEGW